MKSNLIKAAAICAVITLAGCATSQKVEVVQPTDGKLSCSELKSQRAELDTVLAKNNKNKGMTGTNVAAALFFWPALAYTYMDAKDAEKVISDRKTHLSKLMIDKGC